MICPNCGKSTALRDRNPEEYKKRKIANALRTTIIRKKNGKPSGPPSRINKDDVVRLRKLGLSLREVAKEVNCSFNRVHKILISLGLK